MQRLNLLATLTRHGMIREKNIRIFHGQGEIYPPLTLSVDDSLRMDGCLWIAFRLILSSATFSCLQAAPCVVSRHNYPRFADQQKQQQPTVVYYRSVIPLLPGPLSCAAFNYYWWMAALVGTYLISPRAASQLVTRMLTHRIFVSFR